HRMIDRRVTPRPEAPVGEVVEFEQAPRFGPRAAEALREALLAHPVLDGQGTLLEALADRAVRGLRPLRWDRTRLLPEGQVGIARCVRRHHPGIARERGGDPKLLLRVVEVRDA